MDEQLLHYRIGLTLIKGIGNALAKNLIAYVGSEEGIFREKAKRLALIPGIGQVLSTEIANADVLVRAEKEVQFIVKNKINALYFTEKNYPYRLKECTDAPILIYTKGLCDVNAGKFIAIVGTRHATELGREQCRALVRELSKNTKGAVIVSGMAYGVDICAHKAALDCGLPTIAVLGHGLDRIYPQAHKSTVTQMLPEGLLLTEYRSGTNPDRQNFVQRNRVIAGLCDATVVIESAERGGALITAELANDYSRDVFAYPGRPTDNWSVGCNALIKYNKASLIESASDLIRCMNWEQAQQQTTFDGQTKLFVDLSEQEQDVLSLLRHQPDGLQLNEIALKLETPVSKVSSMLLEMEFSGLVKCLPGSVYRVVK